jgi:hypothetical protein
MRGILIVALMLWHAAAAMAQEDAGLAVARAIGRLPEEVVTRLQRDDGRLLERLALVIAGQGDGTGIDRAGIDRHIAVERADLRTIILARLLAADLDNDGVVRGTEVQMLSEANSAYERGLLRRAFRLADIDGDAAVGAEEMRAHAQAYALTRLTEAEAQVLRAVPLCDLDGDGRASVDELAAVANEIRRQADATQASGSDI